MKKFLIIGGIIASAIIFFLIFKSTFTSSSKKEVGETKNSGTNTDATSFKWVFDHSIDVEFGGEYTEVIYCPSGMGMSFKGATQPYEVINSKGESALGQKGQDVSTQIPKSHANMELRFRSQNGQKGRIKIMLYRQEQQQHEGNSFIKI